MDVLKLQIDLYIIVLVFAWDFKDILQRNLSKIFTSLIFF